MSPHFANGNETGLGDMHFSNNLISKVASGGLCKVFNDVLVFETMGKI